jgi:hypothetical protein
MKLKADRPYHLRFLRKNLLNPEARRLGLSRVLPLVARGFSVEQIGLYGLTPGREHGYFPERARWRLTLGTNEELWPVLHDKLFFDRFLEPHLPLVRLEAVALGGALTPLPPFEATDVLEGRPMRQLVVKPLRGGSGVGLSFVAPHEEGALVDGQVKRPEQFLAWLRSLPYHGVYPRVAQHAALDALFAGSANTVRAYVYRRRGQEPRLLASVLRVGVAATAPVDNFSQGSVSVLLDEAGSAVNAVRRIMPNGTEPISHHPDSGAPLSSFILPYYAQVRESLLGFHERFPGFDLVGWDVLVTPEGPVVIEGNHNPGFNLLFVHRTLNDYPDFVAFYREKGFL